MEIKSEIWISSTFTAESAGIVREKIMVTSAANPIKPITVYINSYGGNVDSLHLLIDTFKNVPNDIYTVCMGTAMSAGALLLSCGDKRFISPNSRVMIHKVSSGTWGNIDDMKIDTEEAERQNAEILKILSKNTKKTVKQLETLLKDKRDLFLNAPDAVKFGLADVVGIPVIQEATVYALSVIK